MLVLPHSRRKRAAADAARRAVKHRAVRCVATAVMPPFHAARKALALAHAAYIHEFAGLEILDQHAVADLRLILRLFDAYFLQHLHRRRPPLLVVPPHIFVHYLRLAKIYNALFLGPPARLSPSSVLHFP